MEIQAIHHTVSLLQSHQTWRVPTPSLIIYPGVIYSDAGGLLMFQVSYLDWFPVLQNLIYKLIVQKTQSSLSLISRRLYMLSLRWDKDTSRRTDLITGKGRHPLSVLALTASSTLVFLTNTSKLLTPNCIIDLVPKTPACLATLPESCLWRKYAITPEAGELLGEFRIWYNEQMRGNEPGNTCRHQTPDFSDINHLSGLPSWIWEKSHMGTFALQDSLLPASLLMFSSLFRRCNFHVSVHCHFFNECMLSAHLYCIDTFLRSEDTVTKAINQVSSLPCNLHAMIANVMCPKVM